MPSFPTGIATQCAILHVWGKRAKDFGKVKACCSAGTWNDRENAATLIKPQ
jgi:hypothetical protein